MVHLHIRSVGSFGYCPFCKNCIFTFGLYEKMVTDKIKFKSNVQKVNIRFLLDFIYGWCDIVKIEKFRTDFANLKF